MAISRVSDSQTFSFLIDRAGRMQVGIRDLQDQIVSGKRLLRAEDDPAGASLVVRSQEGLAALAQHAEASRFGEGVLGAQDEALGEAGSIMVRAQEIATQHASSLTGDAERAAAREEVHGLLQGLTAVANSEYAGRRLFGNLALDGPPPFQDPDAPGYTAATAYQAPYAGSTFRFAVRIGADATERVDVSTPGDTVFGSSLVALEALENALVPGGDVAATMAGLAQGREQMVSERASVGARQSQLVDRTSQVGGLELRQREALSRVQDADLVEVVAQLTQAQTALQAMFAAASALSDTNLLNLVRL
jgi:flagellar hook-associated protein 3 FlgL